MKTRPEKVVTPIYLDNASTTRLDPMVGEAMAPYLNHYYGNPSVGYRLGTMSKVAIERARRTMTTLLHGEEGTFFFTSGGTEANNWAIRGLVEAYQLTHIITSPLEHMSVLAPIQYLQQQGVVTQHMVPIDAQGELVYEGLEVLLKTYPHSLVSLMHGNNELGNLTDIVRVGKLCKAYGALLHSDMAQTLGYCAPKLSQWPVDVCTASAHKLHGPKGIGCIYVRHGVNIAPLLYGGTQEKGLRGGTENVAYIVGFAKALEQALLHQEEIYAHIHTLKKTLIARLQAAVPAVVFHGGCLASAKSLPTIVNVGFPWPQQRETLLLALDSAGIGVSAGSACMSGAGEHSHVLTALGVASDMPVVRFSFSKYTCLSDVEQLAKKIATYSGRYFSSYSINQ